MRYPSCVHSCVIASLIFALVPATAAAVSGIGGNVAFWGDPGGGTQIEVAAHVHLDGPPIATFRVYGLSGYFELYLPDGTYYVSGLMARDGVFGEPRPEDVLSWWDPDSDGEANPVTVSGGMANGHDIKLGYIYVDTDATGLGIGNSWEDAHTDLQTAIDSAVSGIEVWVAEGTYVPGTDRSDSFQPKSAIPVYGGFSGTETIRHQRDWKSHPTILSGEIGTAAPTDNCYHVVYAYATNYSSVFDGFTITGGYADGTGNDSQGGGVLAHMGVLTLANVTVTENYALTNGGGVSTAPGVVVAVNSHFADNTAGQQGGGFFLDAAAGSSKQIINSVFTGNTAEQGGGVAVVGEVYAPDYEPSLVNLSLSDNSAGVEGGGIFINTTTYNPPGGAPPTIDNCIVWGNTAPAGAEIFVAGGSDTPVVNYSIVQGGWTSSGSNNLNVDPSFADADLRLNFDSPAIDAGDTTVIPTDTMDIDGDHQTDEPIGLDADSNRRPEDPPSIPDTGIPDASGLTVDMGAYETQLFEDGFESGGTGAWSDVVGGP